MTHAGSTRSPGSLVLIGLRGSGKTTVAREIATVCTASTGRRIETVDLDALTPAEAGEKDVAAVFVKQGEAAFRAAEVRALGRVLATPITTDGADQRDTRNESRPLGRVLALGGGTPMAVGGGTSAADLLRSARRLGAVFMVYLHAEPRELRARLARADNAQRPPLTSAGLLAEIEAVYAVRDPVYRQLADAVVDVSALDAQGVADRVLAAWRRWSERPAD